MPWVRLDDRFPSHRKVATLSDRAFRLHVTAMCWCSENLTEGKILFSELRVIAHVRGINSIANELVNSKLWDKVDDGWVIHDFLDYNPDREQVEAERARNAARQKAYRERRKAERQTAESGSSNSQRDVRNGVTHGVTNGPVTLPPARPPLLPTEEELAGQPRNGVTHEPVGELDDGIPDFARPLVDALWHAGVQGLRWGRVNWFEIHALIKAKGVDAMAKAAAASAPRAQGAVTHATYFVPGWRELSNAPAPQPAAEPEAPEPDWCGHCAQPDYRYVDRDGDDRWSPCPTCNPGAAR